MSELASFADGPELCHRPEAHPECSGSDTPIEGPCVCGASTYPGGLIIGGSGYLAANKVAEDMGVERWWKPTAEMEKYARTYLD